VTFFESLLVLLLAAIVLLQVARRFGLPYPAMLAAGGMLVALVPDSPTIRIEPETALALFIAPPLVDAAFDFPVGSAKRFWRPLVTLAVLAVLVTTAVVAWMGWRLAGLPVAAAIALGAIVAPPDAAAAIAILRTVSVPANTAAILKGESLFNDATALLLYGGAVAVTQHGGLTAGVEARLLIAAPGGIVLGIGLAMIVRRLNRFVAGTLGGNLLQFVMTWLAWIAAARLGLSSVLCLVAFAMWLARSSDLNLAPRMRVHSYAVWATVVFLLNVIAFLVIGMQVRTIVAGMRTTGLAHALIFAGLVVLAVIGVRFVLVLAYTRVVRYRALRSNIPEPSLQQGVLVGWNGMRGLVTLATAFALPQSFPHRDLIVLTAFCVVIATTVLQGATLRPLIRVLQLDRSGDSARALSDARNHLLNCALDALQRETDAEAELLKGYYRIRAEAPHTGSLERHRRIGLAVLALQRSELNKLLQEHSIDPDAFDALQEELDWRALDLLPRDERRIEEG
jgi:NhaP-type Na+/H+ or K+/H+ antiporter